VTCKPNAHHSQASDSEYLPSRLKLRHSSLNQAVNLYLASFLLVFVLLMSWLFPGAVLSAPPGPGGDPPLVTVEPVKLEEVNPPKEYVGHVEAIQMVDLQPQVKGYLEEMKFKEGEYVRAGQILYVIERAPYQARLDAARAQVEKARAELFRAERLLKRLQSARPESVPATDMDNAEAAALAAKAQLAEAEAAMVLARIDLEYTTIKAPFGGRIGPTAYDIGNLVGPTSGPLARIVQMDPIRVVYSVSETDLPSILDALKEAGDKKASPMVPSIKLPHGEMYKNKGRLEFINNEVDSATGSIAVRALFDNPEGLLFPGQYVKVLVSARDSRRMPVVPQSAVQIDQEGKYVLLVDSQNRVELRRINTGAAVGGKWIVESGLSGGEQLIVEGIQKAQPGQAVKTTAEVRQGR
jgi:RND family efflux transporter MFP subunit